MRSMLGIAGGMTVVGMALVLGARPSDAQVRAAPANAAQTKPGPTISAAGSFATLTKIEPTMARPSALKRATPDVKAVAVSDAAAQPTVAPRPKSIMNSCEPGNLKLRWPLDGEPGRVWGTHNYTDQDTNENAKRDFRGTAGDLAMTYDTHRGYDIVVGSFRAMDRNIVLARAAAPGKVIETADGFPDRETTCREGTGRANHVQIQHGNGFVTFYGHMKKGSLKVAKGDVVAAGAPLGVVGSSGCSSDPHLHFEIRDCENKWFDAANVQGMWPMNLGTLEASGILDVLLTEGMATEARVQDPPPDIMALKKGAKLGVGITAMLRGGDDVLIAILGAGNDIREEWTASGRYGMKRVRFEMTVPNGPGPVSVGIWVNGVLKDIRAVVIVA